MRRLALALTCVFLPLAAQAQLASWCAGGIVADTFDTRVTPGFAARANYSMVLRNTQATPRRFVVNVTASVLDRPNGAPISLAPGQRLIVQLGHQTILPGTSALRGEQLANVTRVSCV